MKEKGQPANGTTKKLATPKAATRATANSTRNAKAKPTSKRGPKTVQPGAVAAKRQTRKPSNHRDNALTAGPPLQGIVRTAQIEHDPIVTDTDRSEELNTERMADATVFVVGVVIVVIVIWALSRL